MHKNEDNIINIKEYFYLGILYIEDSFFYLKYQLKLYQLSQQSMIHNYLYMDLSQFLIDSPLFLCILSMMQKNYIIIIYN